VEAATNNLDRARSGATEIELGEGGHGLAPTLGLVGQAGFSARPARSTTSSSRSTDTGRAASSPEVE
jgi:hypothetical protein